MVDDIATASLQQDVATLKTGFKLKDSYKIFLYQTGCTKTFDVGKMTKLWYIG